jgi:arginyl-tRNA synthetase
MINSFYQQGKILDPENIEVSSYRLYLLSSARQTLGKAMDLICVPRVETM